jgi:hypothetical protein
VAMKASLIQANGFQTNRDLGGSGGGPDPESIRLQ